MSRPLPANGRWSVPAACSRAGGAPDRPDRPGPHRRPTGNQVDDIIAECREAAAKGQRVLITTLTKKMAEALSEYMYEAGIRVRYLHSDIDTLEREIMRDLRLGVFDVLIGINLREGSTSRNAPLSGSSTPTRKAIFARRRR